MRRGGNSRGKGTEKSVKVPKYREHTGRSPKVGREGETGRRKMMKIMEGWLKKEKEVESKAESQETEIGGQHSKGKINKKK